MASRHQSRVGDYLPVRSVLAMILTTLFFFIDVTGSSRYNQFVYNNLGLRHRSGAAIADNLPG